MPGFSRTAFVIALCMAVAALGACGSDDDSTDAGGGSGESTQAGSSSEPYEIYFSINFTGNAPRQQIMRTMKAATEKGPMAGKVQLTDSVSNNTIPAQAQDINNIVQRDPDAIVILPSSESGLNASIKRACDAGITVVAFDSPVSAPCAYNVGVDFTSAAEPVGNWVASKAGGGPGAILVDQGIPGLPVADQIYEGYVNGIKAVNPDIEIVNFQSEFTPGPEKAAVANLIPANRDKLLGVLPVSFVTAVEAAVKEAGLDPVPIGAMTALNGDTTSCLNEKQPCFMGGTPMTQGAIAMKLAFDLLEGTADENEHQVVLDAAYLTNDAEAVPEFDGVTTELIEEGVNAFPDLPPDLSLPFATDWLDITAEEAAGS